MCVRACVCVCVEARSKSREVASETQDVGGGGTQKETCIARRIERADGVDVDDNNNDGRGLRMIISNMRIILCRGSLHIL